MHNLQSSHIESRMQQCKTWPSRLSACFRCHILLLLVAISVVVPAAKADANVVIRSRVDDGPWLTAPSVHPLKGQSISLKVDEVPAATIRWYRIVPDLSRNYQNANQPWEDRPYQWTGFAEIRYSREELTKLRGRWEVDPFRAIGKVGLWEEIRSGLRRISWRFGGPQYEYRDVGSFWFQAEVEVGGRIERSPGIDESDEKGLSPSVFRVSIRDCDGYLGYVASFLNVPGLFGSTAYQSANYIGVDCADVLDAAHAKWMGRSSSRDYNVAMLVDELTRVAEFELKRGNPDTELEWGSDVHPGDLIAVRYRGSRQYGHIGALHSDLNRNGILDRWDLVLHAGPSPLHYSPLRSGAFEGHVVVLRFPTGFQ